MKFAIAVHGGAGKVDDFIREHEEEYKKGIEESLEAGYKVLENGGTAIKAVETAIRLLEDNPLFNAGRGAAFTEKGTIEMCASIACGKENKSGAAAIVKNVKNPISLALKILENPKNCYLGNEGALEFAKKHGLEIMPDDYFFTSHQFEDLRKARKENKEVYHGTVGAVALDKDGNIAAGTSTGGSPNARVGRIGDSSMIGVGTYAKNKTCAVSTTGDGEYLIQGAVAYDVTALMEYKNLSLAEAAHYEIQEKHKNDGDMGLIGIDVKGNIAIEFNCERMHRGFKKSDGESFVAIY